MHNKIVSLIIGAIVIAPWLASISARDLKLPHPDVANQAMSPYRQFLFADFDGDKLPDRVELSSTGQDKDILIGLSNFRAKLISFDSGRSEPGELVSGDIDHDDDQDLVWYSRGEPETVFFCLNDGRGGFGPATRYQSFGRQPDLDLKPLLDRGTGSQLSGQRLDDGTDCAVSTDNLPLIEAAAWPETITADHHDLKWETDYVRSFYLKNVLKRGPPAAFPNSQSNLMA